jgi:hypothetical protein
MTFDKIVGQKKLEIKQAFETLRGAKARLQATLGDKGGYYHNILPSSHNYGDSVFEERSEKEVYDHLTRNAWKYILDQTGLKHYMTEKRRKEMEEQIQKNELPPLTADNIMGTLQGLAGRVKGLLDESIKEVFDWLRPHSAWVRALSKQTRDGRSARASSFPAYDRLIAAASRSITTTTLTSIPWATCFPCSTARASRNTRTISGPGSTQA